MKLGKEFIVTFTLLISLGILVLILGIWFLRQSSNNGLNLGTGKVSPTPKVNQAYGIPNIPYSQARIALDFYSQFISCLKTTALSNESIKNTYCQTHNVYTGSKLLANLKIQSDHGYVPVICGKDLPEKVVLADSYSYPTYDKNTLGIVVYYMANSNDGFGVSYELASESGELKVENIVCPGSDGAMGD